MIWARRLQSFGSVPFNHGALLPLLADYRRPNDKIAALLARGDLVQLRRGLYMLGAELRTTPVSLPLVANVLFGPSYVSLDFALSWHALIPEGVVEVSSVTPRRTREFATPLGRFSYSHLPPAVYAVGVRMESTPQGSHFLMASAEKALCDKLLLTRNRTQSVWQACRPICWRICASIQLPWRPWTCASSNSVWMLGTSRVNWPPCWRRCRACHDRDRTNAAKVCIDDRSKPVTGFA